ncbi:unnamed protein product [Acanthosepion pharaonis]|uniref:Uncharacterized protein n=1 Tax=Acanthosepion pharaonis TaxID=158019 RepID=A0A812B6E8_ACAPH|nr:unnamed protein product [Sepia pharaonis]
MTPRTITEERNFVCVTTVTSSMSYQIHLSFCLLLDWSCMKFDCLLNGGEERLLWAFRLAVNSSSYDLLFLPMPMAMVLLNPNEASVSAGFFPTRKESTTSDLLSYSILEKRSSTATSSDHLQRPTIPCDDQQRSSTATSSITCSDQRSPATTNSDHLQRPTITCSDQRSPAMANSDHLQRPAAITCSDQRSPARPTAIICSDQQRSPAATNDHLRRPKAIIYNDQQRYLQRSTITCDD